MVTVPNVHIRFNGLSYNTDFEELSLHDQSTDDEIREAAARYVETPASKFENFVVDRNSETGDITLRPSAVFGNPVRE